MHPSPEELRVFPLLRACEPESLAAVIPYLRVRAVEAGDTLCRAGARVETLDLVVSGELRLELGDEVLGLVRPGESVGESATFLGDARAPADVVAASATRLVTVPVESFLALRRSAPAVYEALVDTAVATVARRLASVSRAVATTAVGDAEVPVRAQPSFFARLGALLAPARRPVPAPDILPALRSVRGLAGASDTLLGAVAPVFVPEHLDAGAVLYLEGEPRSCSWLIGSGAVDLLRTVKGRRAERLTRIGPGALVGPSGLVSPGPRTTHAVVAAAGWYFRVDAAAVAALAYEPRVAVRTMVLAALSAQLRTADAALASAVAPPVLRAASFPDTGPRMTPAEPLPDVSDDLEVLPDALVEVLPAPSPPANDDGRFAALLAESGFGEAPPEGIEGVESVGDLLRARR